MNWNAEYVAKTMSAAQALAAVRSGDRVWIQSGRSEERRVGKECVP